MIRKLTLLFLGCSSLFQLSASDTSKTFLYAVSGNGLTDTSYLYGTIHMMCEGDFSMQKKITQAFDKTEQLYLELDMDDPKEMEKMMASTKGKKKLTEILTPEQQKRLDKKLQADMGVPLSAVNEYSLTTISSMLMLKGLGCDNVKSYEQEFMSRAKEQDKSILGLEKTKYQLKCLKKSSDQEDTFESIFDEKNDEMLSELVELYKEQDIAGLEEMFTDTAYMDEQMREWLLVKRNEKWVKKMPKIMQDKPTFFAVGLGHLLGDYGVLELLKSKGYSVSPVTH